jgi:hypothetical protein
MPIQLFTNLHFVCVFFFFTSFILIFFVDSAAGGVRLMETPNAGGNSENSEGVNVIAIIYLFVCLFQCRPALSFEVIHRLLGATLLKAEMEIKYRVGNWKKTDYVCKINEHTIAVSVTRAVGYPKEEDFDVDQAVDLLKKKLFGLSPFLSVLTHV